MKRNRFRRTVAIVKLNQAEEDALRQLAEAEDLPRTTIVRRLIRREAATIERPTVMAGD